MGSQGAKPSFYDNVSIGGQNLGKSDGVKRSDRAHWFLSNAEVILLKRVFHERLLRIEISVTFYNSHLRNLKDILLIFP